MVRGDAAVEAFAGGANEHGWIVGCHRRRGPDRRRAAGEQIIEQHVARIVEGGFAVDEIVDDRRNDAGAGGQGADLAVDGGAVVRRRGRRRMRPGPRGRIGRDRHEGNLPRPPLARRPRPLSVRLAVRPFGNLVSDADARDDAGANVAHQALELRAPGELHPGDELVVLPPDVHDVADHRLEAAEDVVAVEDGGAAKRLEVRAGDVQNFQIRAAFILPLHRRAGRDDGFDRSLLGVEARGPGDGVAAGERRSLAEHQKRAKRRKSRRGLLLRRRVRSLLDILQSGGAGGARRGRLRHQRLLKRVGGDLRVDLDRIAPSAGDDFLATSHAGAQKLNVGSGLPVGLKGGPLRPQPGRGVVRLRVHGEAGGLQAAREDFERRESRPDAIQAGACRGGWRGWRGTAV